MIIAVDFDGTIVEHAFPHIGDEIPHAIEWLKRFRRAGAALILWTVRSDGPDGDYLTDAMKWCEARGLRFDSVNAPLPGCDLSSSPKVYCDLFIDDRNACCPLTASPSNRSMVADWNIIGPTVMRRMERGSGC
jgi:hypothetical protein